jgi:hypothetical protein
MIFAPRLGWNRITIASGNLTDVGIGVENGPGNGPPHRPLRQVVLETKLGADSVDEAHNLLNTNLMGWGFRQ